jgi:hypothetical protein
MQTLEDSPPPFSGLGQFQERPNWSALRTIEKKKEHAGRVHRARAGPSQQPGLDEGIERFGDVLEVVAHKASQLLAGQQSAWMPVQEYQQVELARTVDDRRASEQAFHVFWLRFR